MNKILHQARYILTLTFISQVFLLNAQLLTVGSDTAFLDPGNGNYVNAYIPIQNSSGAEVEIEWETIENTLNPDWNLQFCDFEFCYTNDFEPLKTSSSGTLIVDYDDDWYLGVDLAGNPADSAIWVVELTTISSGRKDTMVWVVTDENPVSTGALQANSIEISLYPNPASNLINIKNPDARNLNYRILDVAGKELQNGRVTRDYEPITIDALPAGMYFVAVTDEKTDERQLLKFIKQ